MYCQKNISQKLELSLALDNLLRQSSAKELSSWLDIGLGS